MKNLAAVENEAELLGLKWKEIVEKSFRQDISHKGYLLWKFESFRECEKFAKEFGLQIIEGEWKNGEHYITSFNETSEALSYTNEDDKNIETTYYYKDMTHKALGVLVCDNEEN